MSATAHQMRRRMQKAKGEPVAEQKPTQNNTVNKTAEKQEKNKADKTEKE